MVDYADELRQESVRAALVKGRRVYTFLDFCGYVVLRCDLAQKFLTDF